MGNQYNNLIEKVANKSVVEASNVCFGMSLYTVQTMMGITFDEIGSKLYLRGFNLHMTIFQVHILNVMFSFMIEI